MTFHAPISFKCACYYQASLYDCQPPDHGRGLSKPIQNANYIRDLSTVVFTSSSELFVFAGVAELSGKMVSLSHLLLYYCRYELYLLFPGKIWGIIPPNAACMNLMKYMRQMEDHLNLKRKRVRFIL